MLDTVLFKKASTILQCISKRLTLTHQKQNLLSAFIKKLTKVNTNLHDFFRSRARRANLLEKNFMKDAHSRPVRRIIKGSQRDPIVLKTFGSLSALSSRWKS